NRLIYLRPAPIFPHTVKSTPELTSETLTGNPDWRILNMTRKWQGKSYADDPSPYAVVEPETN
ncbi:hypothetical protein, partial [Pseudomonas aeruginosa]